MSSLAVLERDDAQLVDFLGVAAPFRSIDDELWTSAKLVGDLLGYSSHREFLAFARSHAACMAGERMVWPTPHHAPGKVLLFSARGVVRLALRGGTERCRLFQGRMIDLALHGVVPKAATAATCSVARIDELLRGFAGEFLREAKRLPVGSAPREIAETAARDALERRVDLERETAPASYGLEAEERRKAVAPFMGEGEVDPRLSFRAHEREGRKRARRSG